MDHIQLMEIAWQQALQLGDTLWLSKGVPQV